MKPILKIVAICAICAATLMSGCIGEHSSRTYVGYSLDVGFADGRYTQYENIVDVDIVYDETGYYTRKVTFADGSWITYPHVVDERITKGLLYDSMILHFKDGRVEHLDYVTGYQTESQTQPYWDIDLTFADGSKKCLHSVTSYRSL